MLCSVIIPTIGRSTLTRAVESALAQTLPVVDFEVIVVNDSGVPLPEAGWQSSEQVHVINTHRRERSIARNTGASISKGKYLHFLDDDDWLAPGAYQHLWRLSQSSEAKWLYGMTQLVDRQNNPLIQLKHRLVGNCFVQTMAGEWIPLQSSWIERKAFMRIGGFNPLLTGPEDIDLLRRITLQDEIADTVNVIAYVIMGGEGSTTDYVQHPQASRRSREHILDAPLAFTRMRSSAVDPFWCGRMTRVYLTSTLWNLVHGRFFTGMSRSLHSIESFVTAGTSVLSRDFWRAVARPYESITFNKGIREARLGKGTNV